MTADRGAPAPSNVRLRIVYDDNVVAGVSAASDALLSLLGARERAIRPPLVEPDDEPLDDEAA